MQNYYRKNDVFKIIFVITFKKDNVKSSKHLFTLADLDITYTFKTN